MKLKGVSCNLINNFNFGNLTLKITTIYNKFLKGSRAICDNNFYVFGFGHFLQRLLCKMACHQSVAVLLLK